MMRSKKVFLGNEKVWPRLAWEKRRNKKKSKWVIKTRIKVWHMKGEKKSDWWMCMGQPMGLGIDFRSLKKYKFMNVSTHLWLESIHTEEKNEFNLNVSTHLRIESIHTDQGKGELWILSNVSTHTILESIQTINVLTLTFILLKLWTIRLIMSDFSTIKIWTFGLSLLIFIFH